MAEIARPLAENASQFINQRTKQQRYSDPLEWRVRATSIHKNENDQKNEFTEVLRSTPVGMLHPSQLVAAFRQPPIAITLTLEFERYFVRAWANTDISPVKYPEVGIAANVPVMDVAIGLFMETCDVEAVREDRDYKANGGAR
jgi:hypothetical protein